MATTFGASPQTSYYEQIAADLNSNTPGASLIGAEGAAAAPQQAQLETQFAGIEQQLGDLGPSLAQQSDYATLLAGDQLGGLGINSQQTALQQQGNTQQYQLTQKQQQEQGQKNQLQFTNQLQSLIGGEAASGAINTGGSKQQQSTLAQNAQWANADLSRQEQLSAGDYARAQQNYGLIGEANGLSQQEVYTRLQYGIDQLGESADPSSLVSQAGNVLSGGAQGVGSTLSEAGLLGGVNASAAFAGLG